MPDAPRATDAYRYDLPPERIATEPAEPRDASRLLVVRPPSHDFVHRTFAALPDLLAPGDVLVVNETRVVRARLRGTREGGGAAEVLVLRPAGAARYDESAARWYALVRPGRKLRAGARVHFGDDATAEVVGVGPDGVREVAFDLRVPFAALLERHGELPLPPYVGPGDAARAERYQTVFARVPGSVAAPTASLHFTEATFAALRARGVEVVPLVLDVGLGTFKPVTEASIDAHTMHAESYDVPAATAAAVAAAKRDGRRVVAAGTTVVRALEAAAAHDGAVHPGPGETALYITPGFPFRVVDAMVTNFHLPASTLLVLVCAFAGYDVTLAAYRTAVEADYRFYSFGDAMLVENRAPA